MAGDRRAWTSKLTELLQVGAAAFFMSSDDAPLPLGYGSDRLELMVRDPTSAHAYWDLSSDRINAAVWPHQSGRASLRLIGVPSGLGLATRAPGNADMSRIARQRPRAEGLTLRGLNQLARELVLATASDWLFMISMGTTVAYAESRVRTQINRFNHLLEQIDEGTIDADWLSRIEACDNIFRTSTTTTLPGYSTNGTVSLQLRRLPPRRCGRSHRRDVAIVDTVHDVRQRTTVEVRRCLS